MSDHNGFEEYARRFVLRRSPGLSKEEVEQAAETWIRYIKLAWDVADRLESDHEVASDANRTEPPRASDSVGLWEV